MECCETLPEVRKACAAWRGDSLAVSAPLPWAKARVLVSRREDGEAGARAGGG
jgi:hypothetical protein